MSIHTEWDHAKDCDCIALSVADADRDLDLNGPDEPWSAPAVLVLGGAGGGCLAIEGTKDDLLTFAERVLAEVQRLPDNLPEPPASEDED